MSKIKLLLQFGSGIFEIQARVGSRLATIIRKEGLGNQDFAECQYKLECAKCAIFNTDGILGNPTYEEEKLLAEKGFINNFRCSCQVVINEEMENKIIKFK